MDITYHSLFLIIIYYVAKNGTFCSRKKITYMLTGNLFFSRCDENVIIFRDDHVNPAMKIAALIHISKNVKTKHKGEKEI